MQLTNAAALCLLHSLQSELWPAHPHGHHASTTLRYTDRMNLSLYVLGISNSVSYETST